MNTNKNTNDNSLELTLTKPDGKAVIVNLSNVFTRHAEQMRLPLNEEILDAAKKELRAYAEQKGVTPLEYYSGFFHRINVLERDTHHSSFSVEIPQHEGTRLAASENVVEVIQTLESIHQAKEGSTKSLHDRDVYQSLIDKISESAGEELVTRGKALIDEIAGRSFLKRRAIGFARAFGM